MKFKEICAEGGRESSYRRRIGSDVHQVVRDFVCSEELSKLASRTAATTIAKNPDKARGVFPRWFKIRYLVVLVILAYAASYLWHSEMPQLTVLKHQQHTLQSQLSTLQKQQTNLKRQVAEYHSKSFLEAYASQHFHLVTPGEKLFDVTPSP